MGDSAAEEAGVPAGSGRLAGGAVPRIAVAVVTMGNRPAEIDALLTSVARQDAPPARIVIVGNGCPLPEFAERLSLPGEVTTVETDENLGCPGGRNVALARLREFGDTDVVVELDDDGLLVDTDVLRRVGELFAADDRLGIVGFRIADENGETQQRHVPRVGASDPLRGGYVTGFLGGGHALRSAMLDEIGDWPAEFFFAHEETDLAWRAADAGWRILYAPELLLQHPKTSPARHAVYFRVNARNRVWLARRRLPLPLIPVHLGVWVLLTLARNRSLGGLRAWFGGFLEGVRRPAGERRPMRWRTVGRLTRLGRPPVI
ncbi:glycosyltransferase family 2 protein [Streptomyces rochei]|uniref:glycosyltransferase family 2 protein n=1 Tax=Streptomyces TaxID=1883 RepID=UPI001C22426C|nr:MULTISPECIES: glycosyltransferase [unclassified Streptomyces]MBU8551033.1 glycosyltransferase [Streptomyces sp. Osf17]MBU8557813.1 glycosyltransferase [Streptomyces sp. Babs14]